MRNQNRTIFLMILPCLFAPAIARSQGFGRGLSGQIVAVRGDILQIRPRFSTQLTRIIIDAKTTVTSPKMTGLDALKPGTIVIGMGDYTDGGGILPRFLMATEERTGFFASKMHGIQAIGYGKSAMFGGKLKSVKPLVVTDDDGKDVTVVPQGFLAVMQMARGDRDMLQVGKSITATGDRTADGLIHARSIQIEQAPGGDGSVFGEVVAVHGEALEIRPSFGDENIVATVSSETQMLRQINVDPDTVAVGDVITVQGKQAPGSQGAASAGIAAVMLIGKQTYPKVSGGGMFAMIRGVGDPSLTCTGKVASLSPFAITQDDGTRVTFTIPGQTPIVDLHPLTLADIKPGDRVMVMGTEGKEGGMSVKTLILGASPVVGLGN